MTADEGRVRLDGVRAHRSCDLPAADRSSHRGLAVTSIERSLIDVGRYHGPRSVGAMLDRAVRDGLTTYPRFQHRVWDLARQGRNGISTARLVLADRGFGDGWGFEKAMKGALRDAGLPESQREFRVHVDGHRYRVDFAFFDSMVGIECDSREWHGLQFQIDHDLERQNRILGTGLLLLRYTSRRLRDDPAGVVAEITANLEARAGTGSAPNPTFPDAKRP